MSPASPSVKRVLFVVACFMLPALGLLSLSYLLPAFALTGSLAQAAYWIAESGGTVGIPVIGVAMTLLLVTSAGLTAKQRLGETVVIVLVGALALGVGAYVNEHFVKPRFAVPRPNIVALARDPSEAPALKMSVEDFYALADKATRSAYLKDVLPTDLPLSDQIRSHWIHETGYSFPSGHSYSSMLFATFFLALGLSCCTGWRRCALAILPLWAVAVCFSRPILRVHSATDVCVGGLEGVVAGVAAFLVARRLLRKPGQSP
jgi:phosphatidylglycerophosphatase B